MIVVVSLGLGSDVCGVGTATARVLRSVVMASVKNILMSVLDCCV